MNRQQVAILVWFGILVTTMGGLTWWLGESGAVLLPITNGVLIACGMTPDRMVKLAQKVGAISWWEGPIEE